MTKRFNKIVCIDKTNLESWAIQKLNGYSHSGVNVYNDYPENEKATIKRIGDAECIFVSWHTKISKEIIQECRNLKYIGLCCSLIDHASSNVDMVAAESNQIYVKGVKDYGDEGVVEFVFSQLISLAKGLGPLQWKPFPTELKEKKLGIIGLGTVGKMVANVASAFGMDVFYFNRTRKEHLESESLRYLPFNELVKTSDVLTTHLPRHTKLLSKEHFDLMKPNSILINTSLGPTYNVEAFKEWVEKEGNFAILDADGAKGYHELCENHDHIIYTKKVSGMTDKSLYRLSQKALKNIEDYFHNF